MYYGPPPPRYVGYPRYGYYPPPPPPPIYPAYQRRVCSIF